jgi:hypothetical protein
MIFHAGKKKGKKTTTDIISHAKAGGCEAPRADWDVLYADVRRVIASKLPLPDLARAATLCKEFQETCVERVRQRRKALITAGEKAFGKELVSSLVTRLPRAMSGLCPCLGVRCECGPSQYGNSRCVVISQAGKPRYASQPGDPRYVNRYRGYRGYWEPPLDGQPCVFIERGCGTSVGFQARLYVRGEVGITRDYTYLDLHGLRDSWELCVRVHEFAVTPVLGLLSAVFTQALPASYPALLEISVTVTVHEWENDDEEVRKSEERDFIAPLMASFGGHPAAPKIRVYVCYQGNGGY